MVISEAGPHLYLELKAPGLYHRAGGASPFARANPSHGNQHHPAADRPFHGGGALLRAGDQCRCSVLRDRSRDYGGDSRNSAFRVPLAHHCPEGSRYLSGLLRRSSCGDWHCRRRSSSSASTSAAGRQMPPSQTPAGRLPPCSEMSPIEVLNWTSLSATVQDNRTSGEMVRGALPCKHDDTCDLHPDQTACIQLLFALPTVGTRCFRIVDAGGIPRHMR